MSAASGFGYTVRKNGDVAITHDGRRAGVVRGRAAARLLTAIEGGGDMQELLARVTGNYQRGNEHSARSHPRNAGTG
jgi:hypothetical protein